MSIKNQKLAKNNVKAIYVKRKKLVETSQLILF